MRFEQILADGVLTLRARVASFDIAQQAFSINTSLPRGLIDALADEKLLSLYRHEDGARRPWMF